MNDFEELLPARGQCDAGMHHLLCLISTGERREPARIPSWLLTPTEGRVFDSKRKTATFVGWPF